MSVAANFRAEEDAIIFISMMLISVAAAALTAIAESRKEKVNLGDIAGAAVLNFIGLGLATYTLLVDQERVTDYPDRPAKPDGHDQTSLNSNDHNGIEASPSAEQTQTLKRKASSDSPLHDAARDGKGSEIARLLETGADPSLKNKRDRPVKPLWRIVWVVSYAALTA